jgi:hypothetical protein
VVIVWHGWGLGGSASSSISQPAHAVEYRPLVASVFDSIARAWSGVGVHADIVRGGVDAGRWDEVRWEGKPGERSIWLIKATGNNRRQSVQRVTIAERSPPRLTGAGGP